MKNIISSIDLLWMLGFYVSTMQVIGAETLYENIDLTLAAGETNLESLQLTIPDMMTMTETSMITMIQVSTLMLTQLQTVTETVSGTCAAAPTLPIQPSVTKLTSGQINHSLVPLVKISTSTIPDSRSTELSSTPLSISISAINTQTPIPTPKSCDCKCLCPASAFPILRPKTISPAPSISTLQTHASIVTPGQSVPPLSSIERATQETASPETVPPNLLAQSTGISWDNSSKSSIRATTEPTSPIIAIALSTSRNVTWTPARPTPNSNPQSIVPFNINTFSLHSSVSVPLNI